MPEFEISIAPPWPDGEWEELALAVLRAAGAVAREIGNERLIASLLLTSDEEIRSLNRDWRDKDRPTNVLSFPMLERDEICALPSSGAPVMLGDIVLAHETCAREAAEKDIPLRDHAAHLLVHGLLHLAGYDHETSPEEAEKMEQLEIKVLALMGIANPYSLQN